MKKRIDEEIQKYEKPSNHRGLKGDELLSYWKNMENDFPLLSAVARSFLGTPASSGQLERDFCFGAMIGTKTRTRINEILFGMCLVLRVNYQWLPEPEIILKNDVKQRGYQDSIPKALENLFEKLANQDLIDEDDNDSDNDI